MARFYGLDFGLLLGKEGFVAVSAVRPDEELFWIRAIRMVMTGDFNPHFFIYPSFYKYLLALVYALYAGFQVTFVFGGSLEAFKTSIAMNPSELILIDRILAATMGTATILVVYRIGKALGEKRFGLVAAFLFSLSYLHVQHSHFGVSDVPVTFFCSLAFYFVLRLYRKGRWKDYLLAGMFIGLAASTKWVGALMAVPFIVAHLLRRRIEGRSVASLNAKFLCGFFLMPGFFLLTSPYCLLDFGHLVKGLKWELYAQVNHADFANIRGGGLWRHFRDTLGGGVGWPVLLASLAGLGSLNKKNGGVLLILLSFVTTVYFYVGHSYLVFSRYMLPLTPFIALLAALFLSDLVDRLTQKKRVLLCAMLAVLLATPSALRIYCHDRDLTLPDSRNLAAEWIEARVGKGQSVAVVSRGINAPALYPLNAIFSERFRWPAKFLRIKTLVEPEYAATLVLTDVYFREARLQGDDFLKTFNYIVVNGTPGATPLSSGSVFKHIAERYQLAHWIKGGSPSMNLRVGREGRVIGPDLYIFRPIRFQK